MKFAIINDMHIGPKDSGYARGVHRKLTGESERLVKSFVKDMNAREKPEFVVCLGDLIEDVNNREVDIDSFQKAIGLLKPLEMSLYCLVGNHDVRTLSQDEIAKMLGHDHMYYSFDHGDYHFVALSFEMTGHHTKDVVDIRAEVPPHQIDWLKADLAETKKPTVIFIHYPLPEDDLVGNFWFQGETNHALIGNRAEVRKLLEEAGNVRAVISAHQHWNRMHVHNDIPYFTVTSLVENFNNDGVPSEAYTLVNLNENDINVNVMGNDPATFNFSFKN